MPLECPSIQKNWRNYALPASLYRSTHSLEYDGISDWSAQYNLFGISTFPIRRFNLASVSIWVKATGGPGFPGESVIVTRWFPHPSVAINEGGWRWYLWDVPASTVGAMVFQCCTYFLQGVWIHSNASFPLNQWVHVVMTWDGDASTPDAAGLKMYWDGVQQATTTIFSNWTTNAINSSAYSHLMFGTSYTGWPGGVPTWPPVLSWWWEGQLDEVGLWYAELTQDEVTTLYNNGHPESPLHVGLPSKYCFNYYRMGERTDGTPWVFPNSAIIWGRGPVSTWPVAGPNMFYNNSPGRILLDSADTP